MQQLIITILAMLSVILPIIVSELRKKVITPRLLTLFQHKFLTSAPQAIVPVAGALRAGPDPFAGNPDWRKLLAYASAGRNFCIAFICRLFPKPALHA